MTQETAMRQAVETPSELDSLPGSGVEVSNRELRASHVSAGLLPAVSEVSLTELRRYLVADACVRSQRAAGDRVLFTAARPGPKAAAGLASAHESSVDDTRRQLDRFAISLEWRRAFVRYRGDHCRWSQWLFLALLDAGVVYRSKGRVEWCAECELVLVPNEVCDARCAYCGSPAELRRRSAWYLRLSAYNAENDERLDDMPGWSAPAAAQQRAELGRIDGAELDAASLDGTTVTIFAEHPQAIAEAEFVAFAPSHPDVERWVRWSAQTKAPGVSWQDSSGDAETAPIVETDLVLSVPGVDRPLPVVLSAWLERRYGRAAILGTPSVDPEHAAVARRLGNAAPTSWHPPALDAPPRPARRYRASDIPISRQRLAQVPLPIVRCDACGSVPLSAADLPFEPGPGGDETAALGCPQCGGSATAETGGLAPTFDRLVDWLLLAAPNALADTGEIHEPELREWIPALQAVGGPEDAADVLAQRTVAKVLRERRQLSFLSTGEPYERYTLCGRVRAPEGLTVDELADEYGSDAVRFTLLYAAAPHKDVSWRAEDIQHCARFLERVRVFAEARLGAGTTSADPDTADSLHRRLEQWCGVASDRVSENLDRLDLHRATRNVLILFGRIEGFEASVIARRGALHDADRAAVANALGILLELLAPLAPRLSETLASDVDGRTRACDGER